MAIPIEIRNFAVSRGDTPSVEDVPRPSLAAFIVGRKHVKLKTFTPETGDNLVAAIAVQVADSQRVTVDHPILEHMTLPFRVVLGIHLNLVAMPRFDGRDEPALVKVADFDLAAPALRARSGISLCDLYRAFGLWRTPRGWSVNNSRFPLPGR